jgi:hypothetical protein
MAKDETPYDFLLYASPAHAFARNTPQVAVSILPFDHQRR